MISNKKNASLRSRTQFSLIELLVVLAVITILISLLLQTLSKARKSARMTQCANNLNSTSNSLIMFALDNNKYFTYGSNGSVTWDDLLGLGQYDGRSISQDIANLNKIDNEADGSKVYYCPSASFDYLTSNAEPVRTYTVNTNLMFHYNDTIGSHSGRVVGNARTGLHGSAKISQESHPAKTVMVFDNEGAWAQGWKAAAHGYFLDNDERRHSQHEKPYFALIGFVDGSVRHTAILSTSLYNNVGSEEMWDLD